MPSARWTTRRRCRFRSPPARDCPRFGTWRWLPRAAAISTAARTSTIRSWIRTCQRRWGEFRRRCRWTPDRHCHRTSFLGPRSGYERQTGERVRFVGELSRKERVCLLFVECVVTHTLIYCALEGNLKSPRQMLQLKIV
uniref:(northern house mosquito) hypothetical protein n=1 Tax=Culex pipiens TaxID=7175 RepID=A0A8D8BGI8_CULPI